MQQQKENRGKNNDYHFPQNWENMKEQLKDELLLEMNDPYHPGYAGEGMPGRKKVRPGRFSRRYDPYAYESLRRIMEREEQKINSHLNDLRNVQDPNVRRILRKIIMDERRHQTEAFKALNGMDGSYGAAFSLGRSVEDFWSSPENRNLLIGAGAGLLALLILPGAKKKLKNILANTTKGVMGISEQAQDLVAGIREDVEDIIAEAQFENFKKEIDEEIKKE
ncbi:MAG: hypothetical protein ACOWWO_11070 [Peptococcaceae bacterium]